MPVETTKRVCASCAVTNGETEDTCRNCAAPIIDLCLDTASPEAPQQSQAGQATSRQAHTAQGQTQTTQGSSDSTPQDVASLEFETRQGWHSSPQHPPGVQSAKMPPLVEAKQVPPVQITGSRVRRLSNASVKSATNAASTPYGAYAGGIRGTIHPSAPAHAHLASFITLLAGIAHRTDMLMSVEATTPALLSLPTRGAGD